MLCWKAKKKTKKKTEVQGRRGTCLWQSWQYLESLGDFKQAVKYHSQLLSIAKELGDRAGERVAYGNLGNAYQSLGGFKQAVASNILALPKN